MTKYYPESLSANRLKQCYDLAPERIQQYLNAEIEIIRERIKPRGRALELGCGYGRVIKELSSYDTLLFGIDHSFYSIKWGLQQFLKSGSAFLFCMDAGNLGFHGNLFDLVFCIQNGISAFGIDPSLLIEEALRITKAGGKILLSSYSEKFWEPRLDWFRIQSRHGLIGEIDDRLTGDGKIVCKDGFQATTFGPEQFTQILSGSNKKFTIFEVDQSSVFCEIFA